MVDIKKSWFQILCWACIALGVVWTFVVIPINGWNPNVLFLMSVPLAIGLATKRYGALGCLVYYVCAIVISNGLETTSVLTGFPFGNYHYLMEPKIYLVPAQIGPIYASLGYLAWTIANTLLDKADLRLGENGNLFVLPLISGAVMTMWDVISDPQASTIAQQWVWEDAGPYFGVPVSNFLGWWFVTYLFFQAFALFLYFTRRTINDSSQLYTRLAPTLLYGLMGTSIIVDLALGQTGSHTDQAGTVWQTEHIVGTMGTVSIFTMLFVTILAVHKIVGEHRRA